MLRATTSLFSRKPIRWVFVAVLELAASVHDVHHLGRPVVRAKPGRLAHLPERAAASAALLFADLRLHVHHTLRLVAQAVARSPSNHTKAAYLCV